MTLARRRDGLRPRAAELLVYLRTRDLCPTHAEMSAALRCGRGMLADFLTELEERGYIHRLRNRFRAIEVIRPPELHVVYGPKHFELRAADNRLLWANEDRKAIAERGR